MQIVVGGGIQSGWRGRGVGGGQGQKCCILKALEERFPCFRRESCEVFT